MPNLDAPFGLRAVSMLNGGRIPMRKYANKGATTAIFQGDITVLQGADGRVLRLATTSGDDDTIGVSANYVASGTAGQEIWIYDDPFTIFEVQSDGTTSEDHNDAIGAQAAAICTAGNTTSGIAKVELDYSSLGTGTASDNVFKVIGVSKKANNDSASSHAVFEVLLVNHFMSNRSASI